MPQGGSMDNSKQGTSGIELLVEKCRKNFRRAENTDYYDESDYKDAERKFVKTCLYDNPDR
jgi:hypothetical protein